MRAPRLVQISSVEGHFFASRQGKNAESTGCGLMRGVRYSPADGCCARLESVAEDGSSQSAVIGRVHSITSERLEATPAPIEADGRAEFRYKTLKAGHLTAFTALYVLSVLVGLKRAAANPRKDCS